NANFLLGDVTRIPLASDAFSIVTCRYALHHLQNPSAAAAEMARVCRPRGRIALVDVVTTPEKSAAYDRMEKLRDPSHVRALTLEQLLALAVAIGLVDIQVHFYRMELEMQALLSSSFPAPGDEDKVRQLLIE